MERRIRERLHDGVLDALRDRYAIAAGDFRALDAFESFIFEFEAGEPRVERILRLSHSLRRTDGLIRGEIDWINFLAAGGARVAAAVPSAQGNLIEVIEDGAGDLFFATAFVKAEGMKPRLAGWTPALYEEYGRLLGRIHALTQRYEPPRPEWRRPDWDDPIWAWVDQYLPASEWIVKGRYAEECAYLRTLPRDRASYGLAHQDPHGGNMHADAEGRLILFDFDDCGYNWFANDIAMALFYSELGQARPAEFTSEFLTHLLRGYRAENEPADWWWETFPHFLKVREIELYAAIYRDFEVERGGLDAIDDSWCARYMAGRKERIEGRVPVIEFDWASLAR